MSNWTQKKLLLTIGGASLFVCGAAAGGVYYTQGLIEEVDVQITAKRGEVAVADAKIAKIPNLEKDVIILRENLGEYVKILPDEDQLNDFVRMINRFDNQSGVRGTGLKKKNTRQGKTKGRFTPIEYTYEMTATLWQGLKFMNLVENFERFVSVTEFSIQPGKGNSGEPSTIDGEVVHAIKVTMQTYQYNGAAQGKEVVIPKYDDRKEELRDEIWKRMQAIRVDHYEHRGQQGRRDIFVDPRESGVNGGNDPSMAEQKAALERGIAAVEALEKILERRQSEEITLFERYSLDKRFKTELQQALVKADEDAGILKYLPYRSRWATDVVAPLELMQRQAEVGKPEPIEQDPYLAKEDIQTLIALMADDCNNGQLEQARERYEVVQERLAVPESDERHELAVQAKRWHIKASTAIDFKGLDLNVQGVVVNGGGGRSGVLLNGEVFEEGDYVQDDLLVKMVEEEQVWFVFRGLTLVRTM
ncbi:MAG: type 4a pilus biogenesis protein PilO [Planctomycetes bacterium]|nr:type 4a pilus biogenesis protein PilO [Planctomycetota bacterium]